MASVEITLLLCGLAVGVLACTWVAGRIDVPAPFLLILVGVVASLAAWGFLELIYQIQQGVFTHLPKDLGYDGAPLWWSLPVLAIAGLVTAWCEARSGPRGSTSRGSTSTG